MFVWYTLVYHKVSHKPAVAIHRGIVVYDPLWYSEVLYRILIHSVKCTLPDTSHHIFLTRFQHIKLHPVQSQCLLLPSHTYLAPKHHGITLPEALGWFFPPVGHEPPESGVLQKHESDTDKDSHSQEEIEPCVLLKVHRGRLAL